MQLQTLVRERIGIVVVAGIVGLSAAACLPDTSTVGSPDPTVAAVYAAMNQDRAANGLPPLVWSPKLDNLAGTWADFMAATGLFGHRNLAATIGQGDFARYRAMGENILVGPGNMSAGQIEASWMASGGHRANILSGTYNIVGIGTSRSADGRLWVVADFGAI
jgi:uncharacterized protein YkwD